MTDPSYVPSPPGGPTTSSSVASAYVSYSSPTGTILGMDTSYVPPPPPPPLSIQTSSSNMNNTPMSFASPMGPGPRGLSINVNMTGSSRQLLSPASTVVATPRVGGDATPMGVSAGMMMAYGAGATPRPPSSHTHHHHHHQQPNTPSTDRGQGETRESNKHAGGSGPLLSLTASTAARLPSAVRPFRGSTDELSEYLAYTRLNDGSLPECDASLAVSFASYREDRQHVVPSMFADARHTSFYANYLLTSF
jgi:hypothetical protein